MIANLYSFTEIFVLWECSVLSVCLHYRICAIHNGKTMNSLLVSIIFMMSITVYTDFITAQEVFKGTVTYELSTDDGEFPLKLTTNGDKVKASVTMAMGTMDMITDKNAKDQTMVMHSQKMYMQLTTQRLEKMKTMMSSMGKGFQAPIITEPVRTGETKKILNYICEKMVDKSDGNTTEIWVTDKIGYLAFIGSPIIPLPSLLNSDAATFFPLEIRSINSDGDTIMKLTAQEIITEKPIDAEFAVPADYSPFSFPGSGN